MREKKRAAAALAEQEKWEQELYILDAGFFHASLALHRGEAVAAAQSVEGVKFQVFLSRGYYFAHSGVFGSFESLSDLLATPSSPLFLLTSISRNLVADQTLKPVFWAAAGQAKQRIRMTSNSFGYYHCIISAILASLL